MIAGYDRPDAAKAVVLEYGADTKATDAGGKTVLGLAGEKGRVKPAEMPKGAIGANP